MALPASTVPESLLDDLDDLGSDDEEPFEDEDVDGLGGGPLVGSKRPRQEDGDVTAADLDALSDDGDEDDVADDSDHDDR